MKTQIKPTYIPPQYEQKSSRSRRCSLNALATLILALLVGTNFTLSAFTVDDFNGVSLSGWTPSSTPPGGTFAQSGGQLSVTPFAYPSGFAYGKKSDRTFTNLATHTLEFRATVNSILTNGVTTNGLAVLGWVPTGGALGANGYSLGVGPLGAAILVNASFVYTTNFITPLPSSNLVMVVRMTPEGANVILQSSVYSKGDGRFTLLLEHSVTNAPGIIGTAGNAIIGAFNDSSGAATTVSFDDLQVYDTVREVVDDFSGPYPAGWADALTGNGATNYNDGSGHLRLIGGTGNNQVTGTLKSDKTYKITDGVRLELRVDVNNVNYNDAGQFLFLDYSPTPSGFASLSGYSIAHSDSQFYVGKAYGTWWDAAYTSVNPIPTSNYRLIQTLSGEGTAVRIESRMEDLSVGVNEPGRVVYQRVRLDSSSAYQNFDGYYALGIFNGGSPANGDFLLDNAEVNFTANTGNQSPIISGVAPASGKNFHNPAGTVSFTASDDVSVPPGNVSVTLNGVTYASGNPDVTITPPGGSSTSRQFTLTNLAANTFYSGTIQATDNLGVAKQIAYSFDTFLTGNLQIESEDFNYSTNVPTDGGEFIDGGLWAYLNLQGSPEIDYHDSRTGGNGDDPAHYRDTDFPRTYPTADPARAQYVTGSLPELQTYDNVNGDWRNYTRTFAAGTYQVYSRQCTFSLPRSLVTLSKVTSDPHTNNQTATDLGVFIQPGGDAGDTGYDVHRDVLLTDAVGNPAVIRLAAGAATLRVTDTYVDDSEDSEVFHNYLVLIPTADPGTLRPIVTRTAPIAGDTIRQTPATEATFASIANRDTTVTNVVALKMNGVSVPFTSTATSGGIDVSWSLFSTPAAATITNTLIYQDSDGVGITNSWTYGYPFLRATNRLVGALSTRGFDVRMVQTDLYPDPDNTIAKGEDQLSIPPVVPYDRTWQTNVQTLDWDDNTGIPNYVPGLDGGLSGYPIGPYNYIATEELCYLQLTAGAHRFVVVSDDAFQIRSGTSLGDLGATVLGFQNGTFNGTFDFVVEADGLYPMRGMWQEEGGGAAFHLSALNPIGGTNNVVNDPTDPAGGVKAYVSGIPTLLVSSATVDGPYSARAEALIDTATKTVTVPISGSTQFYRMSAASALTIQSITIVGGNAVITWQ